MKIFLCLFFLIIYLNPAFSSDQQSKAELSQNEAEDILIKYDSKLTGLKGDLAKLKNNGIELKKRLLTETCAHLISDVQFDEYEINTVLKGLSDDAYMILITHFLYQLAYISYGDYYARKEIENIFQKFIENKIQVTKTMIDKLGWSMVRGLSYEQVNLILNKITDDELKQAFTKVNSHKLVQIFKSLDYDTLKNILGKFTNDTLNKIIGEVSDDQLKSDYPLKDERLKQVIEKLKDGRLAIKDVSSYELKRIVKIIEGNLTKVISELDNDNIKKIIANLHVDGLREIVKNLDSTNLIKLMQDFTQDELIHAMKKAENEYIIREVMISNNLPSIDLKNKIVEILNKRSVYCINALAMNSYTYYLNKKDSLLLEKNIHELRESLFKNIQDLETKVRIIEQNIKEIRTKFPKILPVENLIRIKQLLK